MEDLTIDSYDEFAAAFEDSESYQTEETGAAEETGSTGPEAQESANEEEAPAGAETGGGGEESEGEGGGSDDDGQKVTEESFIIRVNKQDVTLNRNDMIAYAQKGADYDRVKGQLTESRQHSQNLQSQLDKYQGAMNILEAISKSSNMSIDELVDQIHVNMLTKEGKSEAEAKAEIRAQKAERERDALKARAEEQQKPPTENPQDRAEREIEDFQKRFPGVDLTEDLCKELMADVQGGMPLSDAYQKYEYSRKDAQIAELQRQLAAEKQNKRNRANSPGSQNDSGGRRDRSAEDDFFAAFEK